MDWKEILNNIYTTIGTPAIMAIIAAFSYLGGKLLLQAKNILAAKMELFTLSSENEIRQQVFDILDSTVEAAVASNMQLANKMKEVNVGKLDASNVRELQESCKRLVEHSLPPSLLNKDSSTVNIIGGIDKVNSMISTLIEKHVFEYKNN